MRRAHPMREPTQMEEAVAIALCEDHCKSLRGFYKPPGYGYVDSFTEEPVSDEKHDKLIGGWATQTDTAKDVYRSMARAAFRQIYGVRHSITDVGCAILKIGSGDMGRAWNAMIDAASPPEEP